MESIKRYLYVSICMCEEITFYVQNNLAIQENEIHLCIKLRCFTPYEQKIYRIKTSCSPRSQAISTAKLSLLGNPYANFLKYRH